MRLLMNDHLNVHSRIKKVYRHGVERVTNKEGSTLDSSLFIILQVYFPQNQNHFSSIPFKKTMRSLNLACSLKL